MRLQGKVAIVTGAASGMGLAMATRFAAEGASIVAADWNAERLGEAVRAIEGSGGTVVGSPHEFANIILPVSRLFARCTSARGNSLHAPLTTRLRNRI